MCRWLPQPLAQQNYMQIKLLMVLAFTTLLTGCMTYDYAVNKSNTDLQYRTYYYGDKNKNYDFYTVLYSRVGDIGKSINYNDFTVYIAHMHYKHLYEYKGLYVSEITFEHKDKAAVIIDYASIKLVHSSINGKSIKPLRIESGENNSNKYRSSYKLIFDPKTVPDQLNESIYVEMVVNGEQAVINKKFKIEKTLYYTFWDVLMGV